MNLKFWGTRGTFPRIGTTHSQMGSNHTSCVEINSGAATILLDAGSGLAPAARKLFSAQPLEPIHLFISHFHWDHLLGLFAIYDLIAKGLKIKIYSTNPECRDFLKVVFHQALCPLGEQMLNESFDVRMLSAPHILGDLRIEAFNVPHSGLTSAFCVTHGNSKVIYASDIEFDNLNLSAWSAYAQPDLLICDSFHSTQDKAALGSLGHSSVDQAVLLAQKIEARKLALFHYSPLYDDAQIKQLLANALGIQASARDQMHQAEIFLALDGLTIEI